MFHFSEFVVCGTDPISNFGFTCSVVQVTEFSTQIFESADVFYAFSVDLDECFRVF